MSSDPACITGSGLVTAYGLGRQPCFDQILSGGDRPKPSETSSWPKGSSTVPTLSVNREELMAALPTNQRLAIPPEALMLQAAAEMALADAGLNLREMDGEDVGVVVSTQQAGLQDYAEQFWSGMCEEDAMVSPTRGPWTGFNGPAGHLGIRLGAEGPNVSLLDGGVGGIHALIYALDALADGGVAAMLICGVEVLARISVDAVNPGGGSAGGRPFDRDRHGCAYGNVGAAMVVESTRTCRARGARPQATVLAASTAYSSQGSLKQASCRALRSALDQSQCPSPEIGACFAGANGSVKGDAAEARAIGAVLGSQIPTCAIKGGIGECGGASAVAQALLAITSLERRLVPPTPGLDALDDRLPVHATTKSEALRHPNVMVHAWDEDCAAGVALLRDPDIGTCHV